MSRKSGSVGAVGGNPHGDPALRLGAATTAAHGQSL